MLEGLGLEFAPQNPHKDLGILALTYNPSTGDMGTRKYLGLIVKTREISEIQ